jgi:hypothetical protein
MKLNDIILPNKRKKKELSLIFFIFYIYIYIKPPLTHPVPTQPPAEPSPQHHFILVEELRSHPGARVVTPVEL